MLRSVTRLLKKRMIQQKRHDSNKIYSLHETDTSCIAKGKTHNQYESGSKVLFAILPGFNIVVGAVNFKGNPYDSQTLKATLDHCYKITGKTYDNTIVDRGYKG